MKSRRIVSCCLLALLVPVLDGCSLPWKSVLARSVPRCEWLDVAPSVLAGPTRLEIRARVNAPEVDFSFPLMVERGADSLTLVGLTPLGTKAFSVVRRGDKIEVENLLGPGLPVPPRNVLADISAMLAPSPCAAGFTGSASVEVGASTLVDTCEGGRPAKRKVHRIGGGDSGDVEITYGGKEATVDNEACRYSARYVTVKETAGGGK